MAVDDNRMITFSYAKNNYDTYKIQTIPDTLECMTKDEVKSYISVDQTLLNSLASNQLVRRDKVVGVSLNTPIVFGDFMGTSFSSPFVPGYEEYNDLLNSTTYFNAYRGSNYVDIFPADYSVHETVDIDSRGDNFIQSLITKAKSLAGWSSLTGWSLQTKITGSFINGGDISNNTNNSVDYFLYDSSYNKISTGDINSYKSESTTSGYHLRYRTTILSSGYTPNRVNSNNEISNHTKLNLCTYNQYQKPSDPYDVNGFEVSSTPEGWHRNYNTEYFYFGQRQVIGGNNRYNPAPSGTPNFPMPPCSIEGAMDVQYNCVNHSIKMEFRATDGVSVMGIGSINIIFNNPGL